ncbi:MAG: hypothetical protein U9R34_02705 [Nanoarchaeota archaeon]|nr:hypothetical protein [Nanoarchaeota archaeon]
MELWTKRTKIVKKLDEDFGSFAYKLQYAQDEKQRKEEEFKHAAEHLESIEELVSTEREKVVDSLKIPLKNYFDRVILRLENQDFPDNPIYKSLDNTLKYHLPGNKQYFLSEFCGSRSLNFSYGYGSSGTLLERWPAILKQLEDVQKIPSGTEICAENNDRFGDYTKTIGKFCGIGLEKTYWGSHRWTLPVIKIKTNSEEEISIDLREELIAMDKFFHEKDSQTDYTGHNALRFLRIYQGKNLVFPNKIFQEAIGELLDLYDLAQSAGVIGWNSTVNFPIERKPENLDYMDNGEFVH